MHQCIQVFSSEAFVRRNNNDFVKIEGGKSFRYQIEDEPEVLSNFLWAWEGSCLGIRCGQIGRMEMRLSNQIKLEDLKTFICCNGILGQVYLSLQVCFPISTHSQTSQDMKWKTFKVVNNSQNT